MNKSKTKLTFISGTMFAKKSKALIDMIDECHRDSSKRYLVFKPSNDTRDGLFIKSRVYDKTIEAFSWDNAYSRMYSIFDYMIAGFSLTNPNKEKFIFFDEVHFLSLREVQFIACVCEHYGINVVMAGLETSFKQKYFKSSKWLKDNADEYMFFSGNCNSCGLENAVYNILLNEHGDIITEGKNIQPGSDSYNILCEDCFNK